MKKKRFRNYLSKRAENTPMKDQESVASHSDEKIDQDYPGFPRGHASKKIIKPETETDEKTADVDNSDGEKESG
ncbi:MAG: hypothetical protein ABS85_15840 [Sphingobacteriales bacterium SCN 48-20]|jgi:hypothetical protein|uniref:hypothetical protein n=1 Tax=Terrimonas ferruginea TaxID=249 RepID=UPI00040D1327|nr:hypothetical protein [Terrimonas ferruginea]MBN8783115.1 hypothetical protein [Terrimonas ferruginea]ODT90261.1 MAG: hypothetical protein ABS85_15840 [Sphingobacteriales bacterium SCN 48-20]OJW44289.1 MAG: hypothetical protein BGO56_20630 [Sphingobacteriales bacterium 48-107]